MSISIHTPTKGVTDFALDGLEELKISIHTPTKGVTLILCPNWTHDQISIHTPTKGVTIMAAAGQSNVATFQSTLPRRE